jgi:hypothetical protein
LDSRALRASSPLRHFPLARDQIAPDQRVDAVPEGGIDVDFERPLTEL